MNHRFHLWLEHIVRHEWPFPAAKPVVWLQISLFVGALFAACHFVPGAETYVGLKILPAALAYAPLPLLVMWAEYVLFARVSKREYMAIHGVGTGLVGLFPALLVAFSQSFGSVAFAGFHLLTSAAHGAVMRVSPRFPYFGLAIVAQVLVSLSVNHDPAHLLLWSFMGPASVATASILGGRSVANDLQRESAARMRAALEAQLLETQAAEHRALDARLQELLGVQHDLKSPLTAAVLGTELLRREAETRGDEELTQKVSVVHRALTRTRELIDLAREKLAQERPTAIGLAAVAKEVFERVQIRFSEVHIEMDVDSSLQASLVGGEETLERVLENLLVNACEGDGKRGATRVLCRAHRLDASVELVVEDDGPGFPPEKTEQPLEAFSTTKKDGTGLGLFTVDRLARASGGSIRRENRADGRGARVVVTLPSAA